MRILFIIVLSFVISKSGICQSQKTFTSSEILLQLKKLNVLGSVLYVGAHPDDENNSLLPYFAYEKLYRTAYLSLTRGEGGQNLIGDEQGIELGLIRTQEMLAARRVEGAEQFFTRAYEFGFSKSMEEALRLWDREKILSDVVWVIRKYQPDVIIKRFPPDSRAGHGHHAASAQLADEAFIAAADPNRFPEQFRYGVQPWQAKRIMWNTFNFGSGGNTTSEDQLKIDIGTYNPLLGKSPGEIGGESRSFHKSQGEGRPRNRGQIFQYFTTTGGETAKNDIMDGVVTNWNRLNAAAIQSAITDIISNFKADQPDLSVPGLVKLYRSIKLLPAGVWKEKKLADVQQLIEECSALYIEATSSQQRVVQGDTLRVNFVLNKRKNVDAVVKNIKTENFDTSFSTPLATNQNLTIVRAIPVAGDKKISQPYWLENPLIGNTFDVKDQLLIGKPENDPSFEADFLVNIDGEDILIKRPVQYRVIDPVKGDLYQPIPVLPKVEISYAKENFLSVNNAPVTSIITLKANDKGSLENYLIEQKFSNNWGKADRAVLTGVPTGEKNMVSIFTPKTSKLNTTEQIEGVAKRNNELYDSYTKTISYDHIPTITYFPKAKANLVKLDVKTIGKKIGFIVGAGDRVPQALEAMGYEITYLNEADITDDNLKQFDAIVTGIRAYNIYEYLTNKNDVLNRYVENGGNLIVQYLKTNQVGLRRVKVGPYPFGIDAGARVTEEDAKVNFLLPDHPALNYPNKITEKDFEGWIQERSTYQLTQGGEKYVMPLGMNDRNEQQSTGSLAIAKYGRGNFVYASLVFFRQLPAGVPGAYRLMANLIALGHQP